MLLEVKSMNDIRFKEFKENNVLDFEYKCQINGYLKALGLYKAIVLAKNKNKFDLHETVYSLDDALLEKRIEVVNRVKASETPEAIEKEHQPLSNGYLQWQCNYCPFVQLCWRHEGVVRVKEKLYKIVKS
jgi:hypothetical protein